MAILPSVCLEILSRRDFLRVTVATGSLIAANLSVNLAQAADKAKLLPWQQVVEVVHTQLAARPGYQPAYMTGDLLSRSDVQGALDALKKAGWNVANREEILKETLEDNDFLVRELRTSTGRKFSRAVMSDELVYDRLDRLTKFSGGQNLVHTIITLPDGAKLMGPHPTPALGNLMELLPKQASGFTPTDKNFDKPTGKIYAEPKLLKVLAESYAKAGGK